MVRIINTAPEFGFLVFLPTFFSKELGFGEGRWPTLLAVIHGTNVFCAGGAAFVGPAIVSIFLGLKLPDEPAQASPPATPPVEPAARVRA
ncbi:hypothetical protein [Streptomyces inhibens]|uniref:hypothetical protein n=1 Tax=Streptomyces inhibens TaxID=2293571 RepID=UPI00315AB62D